MDPIVSLAIKELIMLVGVLARKSGLSKVERDALYKQTCIEFDARPSDELRDV